MAEMTSDSTATGAVNSTPAPQTDPSRGFDYYVWVYTAPIVFTVGIIGNILSIVVLQSRAFRHTTTGIYLPLIAAADIVVLIAGLLVELLEVADVFNLREYNIWTCRFYKVIFYSAGDVSIWLIVAFTFDRFIAVCFPFIKRRICSPRRAGVASAVIVLLAITKNFHEFWTRGLEYRETGEFRRTCGSPAEYKFFLSYVRPWIAFTLITALPFLLILVFNVLIVHSLVKAQRVRSRAAPESSANAPASSGFRQTTLMCLSVSFAFLICMAPSIVLLIGKPYWKPKRGENVAYNNAKAINNILVFVNHSVNFFLYCFSGRRFRDELKALMMCRARSAAPLSGTSTAAGVPPSSAAARRASRDVNGGLATTRTTGLTSSSAAAAAAGNDRPPARAISAASAAAAAADDDDDDDDNVEKMPLTDN